MCVEITKTKELKKYLFLKKEKKIIFWGFAAIFFPFYYTEINRNIKALSSSTADQSFEIKLLNKLSKYNYEKKLTNFVTLKLNKHELNKISNKISF